MAPVRKKGGKAAATASQVWNVGDLVLAKVKGFPAWPARVSEPEHWGRPKDRKKVFVFFFGTEQIAFVQPGEIQAFTPDTKKNLLAKAQARSATTDFCRAVKEICEADEGSVDLNENEIRVPEKDAVAATVEKALDVDIKDESKKDDSLLVLSKSRKDDPVQGGPPVQFEEIRSERGAVVSDNGHEARRLSHASDGLTNVNNLKERVDVSVPLELNKKRRKTLAGDSVPNRTPIPATTTQTMPSLRRLTSRSARSSALPNEKEDVVASTANVPPTLEEAAKDLKIRKVVEEGMAGDSQLSVARSSKPLIKTNQLSAAEDTERNDSRLAKDHRSAELRLASEDEQEVFGIGGDGKPKDRGSEARQDVSVSKQTTDSDRFQDQMSHENVPINSASLEEMRVKTITGLVEEKNEVGESSQQTILPRKKRRALLKPERDYGNLAHPSKQEFSLDESQADAEGTAGIAENHRRKRGQSLMRNRTQVVDSDNEQSSASEQKEHENRTSGADISDELLVIDQPLKRQRTTEINQHLSSSTKAELGDGPVKTSVIDNISRYAGRTVSVDEHLPLVKRVRARLEKDSALQGSELNSQIEPASASPLKEAVPSDVAVQNVHTVENGVAMGESTLCVAQEEPKSRFTAERDISLPPKADKYRMRSRIADGEAALPPSKRRQRALEAMSACAAEAAAVVELKCIAKPEGQQELPADRLPTGSLGDNGRPQAGNCTDIVINGEETTLPENLSGQHVVSKSDEFDMKMEGMQTDIDLVQSGKGQTGKLSDNSFVAPLSREKLGGNEVDYYEGLSNPVKGKDGNRSLKRGGSGKSVSKYGHSLNQVKVQGSGDSAKTHTDKPESKPKSKVKKKAITPPKESTAAPIGLRKQASSDGHPYGEKLAPGFPIKNQEHRAKQVVSDSLGVAGVSKVFSDTPSERQKLVGKPVSKELIKGSDSITRARLDTLGGFKLQAESNPNKVREAVEAAKEVKQKRQARFASSVPSFSYAMEVEKFPTGFISSPSPGGSSLLNSPAQVLPAGLIQDSQRMPSATVRAPDIVMETPMILEEEMKPSSREGLLAGDMEALVARDTLEGMLETLSRTRESIARATRHALECSKYGIANEVVEIIVQRLENEPSFHRRVDLFFLVDSITQCSGNLKGVAAEMYPSAVQAALPRLLSAAAPPGSVARENRRQCLKVLRLWSKRNIMPESVLRNYMNDLELYNDDKTCGTLPRRPSRSERAVDDPIREMEGMFVDEYGSNASFALPGLSIPRMFEDDEESCEDVRRSETSFGGDAEEENQLIDLSPRPAEKHRHILEEVEGELEMEDVSPEGSFRKENSCDDLLTRAESGLNMLQGGTMSPPLPSEPPPPPPESPPPSTPPLPESPPPPQSPPPPPPSSPPPPPPPPSPLHSLSGVVPFGSSFVGLNSGQQSSPISQSALDTSFFVTAEQQTSTSLLGSQHRPQLASDEKMYEQYHHQHPVIQNKLSKSSHGRDPAYGSPKSFIMTQKSQSFPAGIPPSHNPLHLLSVPHGTAFSQNQLHSVPSPPQPLKQYSYANSESSHLSSSPSFEQEQLSPNLRHVQGEQQHLLHKDLSRGRFDDTQPVQEGPISSRMPTFLTAESQIGLDEESTYSKKYTSYDHRTRSTSGSLRSIPGPLYTCGPGVQIQGHPQAVTGTPVMSVSSAEMSQVPYTNHLAGIPGGLMLGVAANQAHGQLLPSRGGPTLKWRPN